MRLGDVKNIWKPLRILRKPSWMSGVDSIFRGGSSFAFVEKAVTAYLVEREDSDARLAAAVHEWCEGEAITKFNDAASRADEDIVYEVVSCVEDLIASPSSRLAKGRKKNADPEILGPGNLNHHNSFRFHIYRKLAEKFGYSGPLFRR